MIQTRPTRSARLRMCHVVGYLLNIWQFVYFVCGLIPPKRRVIRRRNLARRRVPTMCRTCAGFYVYRGRRYENNDIFQKCVQIGLDFCCSDLRSVGATAGSRPITAGWLAAAARWLASYSDVAGCRNLIGPCVFINVGRWPKRSGCMQLPRADQVTKSSCSGPTGRNSLSAIIQAEMYSAWVTMGFRRSSSISFNDQDELCHMRFQTTSVSVWRWISAILQRWNALSKELLRKEVHCDNCDTNAGKITEKFTKKLCKVVGTTSPDKN